MTTAELTKAAQDKARQMSGGYKSVELEAAITEGIVTGDRVAVGGGIVAAIDGDAVTFERDGQAVGSAKLSQMTEQQRDMLLICKAAYAGMQTIETIAR